ncbi:glycosyltransferase family 2 protein [Cellulomonas xylanilytica]|uniref:4,4'-diaponeurosporenoate glycosyltransferase n=1 Tax=Cellulomonas xylanilytica TaxID=233583 RepID=A0A510V8K2_9CELL|nr:glycosyltransferase family A protein [Cellulomonas xylanilytica]GEK21485.1 hypothetical protein CXY01_20050 [Cellulomonas xylanilytica]
MSEASLSVIIPAYRAERTIARAVASAFASGADEVIVVDDGSDDSTGEAARDAGAVCVRQENGGASRARVNGSRRAKGTYLVFLDSDDELVPAGVRRSVGVLAGDPALAVAAGTVIGTSDGVRRRRFPVRYRPVTTRTLLQRGFGPWPPAAQVVRADAFRASQEIDPAPLHPRFADDYEALIRLSMVGGVDVRDDPTCVYSMAGGKSVRNARAAFVAKEAVRAHYAQHLDIGITPMTEAEISAGAHARLARAHSHSGEWVGCALEWVKCAAANPVGGFGKVVSRVRRQIGWT